jgi:hypothetical protein
MILNKIMNADSSHLILIKKVQFSSLNKKKLQWDLVPELRQQERVQLYKEFSCLPTPRSSFWFNRQRMDYITLFVIFHAYPLLYLFSVSTTIRTMRMRKSTMRVRE